MIPIGIPTKISYQHDNGDQNITSVTVSLINAYGIPIPININNGTALNLPATAVSSVWSTADFIIPGTEKPQDVRVYFTILNGTTQVSPKEGYTPLRDKIGVLDSFEPEYVSQDYFLKNYIAASSKIDPHFEEAIENYLFTSPNGFEQFLKAAVKDVERDSKITIGKKLITGEQKDFYSGEVFVDNRWILTTERGPLISIEEFSLVYSNRRIGTIDPSYFVLHKKERQFELVPTSGYIQTLSGEMAYIMVNPTFSGSMIYPGSRVPGFFQYSYYAGLDFATLDDGERESIKQAICLKAMIAVIPQLTPGATQGSIGLNTDGVSRNSSYRTDQHLQILEKQYNDKISKLAREYNMGSTEFLII